MSDFNKLSSKIRDLYIGLHGYSFFHSPSNPKQKDKRFIGRKEITSRLKAILTHAETKSGAYLITGYRGMGKTSLVNNVLGEISGRFRKVPSLARLSRIYVGVVLLAMLNLEEGLDSPNWVLLFLIPFFLLGASIAILLITNPNRIDKSFRKVSSKKSQNKYGPRVCKSIRFKWRFFLKTKIEKTTKFPVLKNAWFSICSGMVYLKIVFTTLKDDQPRWFRNVAVEFRNTLNVGEVSRPLWNYRTLLHDYVLLSLIHLLYFSFDTASWITATTFAGRVYDYSMFFAVLAIPLIVYSASESIRKFCTAVLITGVAYYFIRVPTSLGATLSLTLFFLYGLYKLTLLILRLVWTQDSRQKEKGWLWEQAGVAFPYKYPFETTLTLLRNFFNYGHYVHIRINLGHDNLREGDVLRLIAKNMQQRYKANLRIFSGPRRFYWLLLRGSLVYMIALMLYYYEPSYAIINDFRKEIHLSDYFPSQRIFEHNDKKHAVHNAARENIILHLFEHKSHQKPNNRFQKFHFFTVEEHADEDLLQEQFSVSEYRQLMEADIRIVDHINLSEVDSIEVSIAGLWSHLDTLNGSALFFFTSDTLVEFPERDQLLPVFDSNFSTAREFENLGNLLSAKNVQELWLIDIKLAGSNEYYESGIRNNWLQYYTSMVDYYSYTNYTELSHLFIDETQIGEKRARNSLFHSSLDFHPDLRFFPLRIDYLLLFWLLICFIAVRLLFRLGLFGKVNHRYILRRLTNLCENIDAEIQKEEGFSVEQNISSARFSGRQSLRKLFPKTGAQEIETELVYIFSLVEQIPVIAVRPKFVFIFDELDKIEPHANANIDAKQEASGKNNHDETYTMEGAKKRQESVSKILGDLKSFWNTAKARFIFIAGREMYEAAMADITDRDSYIGSIFHDVIYVNSFYTDPSDEKLADITSMTEKYVCQFLVPPRKYEPTLKGYSDYLLTESRRKGSKGDTNEEQKRIKLLVALQTFIIYLTYRSNGSPKKMTRLLEEYIHPFPTEQKDRRRLLKNELVAGDNADQLYLKFTQNDQYVFGFSAHIFNPFLIAVSRYLQEFSDKLLVSTSFLLDHLYKFHEAGFSWSDLELTPEVVAINKAPELREFIDRIIQFHTNNHIREIINGLHQFKFNSKIEKEIAYISKISERESAAYNFTLDESMEIKRHYNNLLTNKIRSFYVKTDFSKGGQRINSIAGLHIILGDLAYNDQEYDEAIFHYSDAARILEVEEDEHDTIHLVAYIKCMLKRGITYERINSYDLALLVYDQVLNLIRARAIHVPEDTGGAAKATAEEGKTKKTVPALKAIDDLRLFYQPMLARLQLIEKHTLRGIKKSDIKWMEDYLQQILSDQSNLKDRKDTDLLHGEVYDKLGDLLYYKNVDYTAAITDEEIRGPISALEYYLKSLEELKSYLGFASSEETGFEEFKPLNDSSFDQLEALAKTLLGQYASKIISGSLSERVINYRGAIPKHALHSIGNALSDVGDSLFSTVNFADTLEFDLVFEILDISNNLSFDTAGSNCGELLKETESKLTLAVVFFVVGGWYYRRAGEQREYSLQLTKVLYLLKDYLRIAKSPMTGEKQLKLPVDFVRKVSDRIVTPAIRAVYRSYENTNESEFGHYEHLKYEDGLDLEEEFLKADITADALVNISIAGEVKEILLVFDDIKLRLDQERFFEVWGSRVLRVAGPYISLQNKYTRIIELNFKASTLYYSMNYLASVCANMQIGSLADLSIEQIEKIEKGLDCNNKYCISAKRLVGVPIDIKGFEILSHLTVDAIFCLSESLKTQNIFGRSYIFNHTFLATCHYDLAEWISFYEKLQVVEGKVLSLRRKGGRSNSHKKSIKKLLEDAIGKVETIDLVKNAQYEKALQNLYQGIEMHTEGDAYLFVTNQMYYLDDDFNDNFFHFSAALERYRINSGFVPVMIDDIRSDKIRNRETNVPKARYYNPEAYYSGINEKSSKRKYTVTVVGCGVIGLTTALELCRRGYEVKLVGEFSPRETTSAKAGAVWFPFNVGPKGKVERWSIISLKRFNSVKQYAGSGVKTQKLIVGVKGEDSAWWGDLVANCSFRKLQGEEVPSGIPHAYELDVPFIEPLVYLDYLYKKIQGYGVELVPANLQRLEEVFEKDNIVVNCTGLGARELCGDQEVYSSAGYILKAKFEEQPKSIVLEYDHEEGSGNLVYIFSHEEYTVLGGTAYSPRAMNFIETEIQEEILSRCKMLDNNISNGKIIKSLIGDRPMRKEIRLQRDPDPTKRIIHNYGHGGAGFTVSWGCAEEAADLVDSIDKSAGIEE